jgi:hypothetical protein
MVRNHVDGGWHGVWIGNSTGTAGR